MRKWLALATLGLCVLAGTVPGMASSRSAQRFTVVFKAETLPADSDTKVTALGGTVVASFPALGVMEVEGSSRLMELARDAHVQAVGPTLQVRLNRPTEAVPLTETASAAKNLGPGGLYEAYQWDIKQVTNFGASWDVNRGSHNTVVGIIDTGVSPSHPDLSANLLGGRNFTPDGFGGTVNPADIRDRDGHGTHVAGTIAGKGRIMGVGPDLGIRAYRVFGSSGSAPTTRIIEAMVAAVEDGVDVISMSLGGYFSIAGYRWVDYETGEVYRGQDVASMVALRRAVHYAVRSGVVVVAAAGNDGVDISHPPSMTAVLNREYGPFGYDFRGASMAGPAALPGVITVSATDPHGILTSYSNYGTAKIDLAAPGGDFLRHPEPGWHLDMSLSAHLGSSYAWMAGTSMAVPKVSATAALVIDQAKANGVRLTPSQVAAGLKQTAVQQGERRRSAQLGHGVVNAYLALGGEPTP